MSKHKEFFFLKMSIYKCHYLLQELEETEKTFHTYLNQFNQYHLEKLADRPDILERIDNLFKEHQKKEEEKRKLSGNVVIQNETMKKLYRKISLKTHPDKCNCIDKHKMFLQAQEYVQKENLLQLLALADDLGINLSNLQLSESDKVLITKNEIAIENKINHFKGTAAWKWAIHFNEEN